MIRTAELNQIMVPSWWIKDACSEAMVVRVPIFPIEILTEIIGCWLSGIPRGDVADAYGIHPTTVSRYAAQHPKIASNF